MFIKVTSDTPAQYGPPPPNTSNESNSIVARLTWRGRSVLFTGDAEPQTERWLLSQYAGQPELLTADVLKVPHHGGKYSSTTAFLDAVHPRLAVISCAAV